MQVGVLAAIAGKPSTSERLGYVGAHEAEDWLHSAVAIKILTGRRVASSGEGPARS